MYRLDVSETEFHGLKKEQSLLVDFTTFPSKFVQYLAQCLACEKDENPKFICVMTSDGPDSDATFAVIETNNFKHLQHLALRFRPGNDDMVKRYLSDRLSACRDVRVDLDGRLESAEAQIQALSSQLENVGIACKLC